MESAATFFFFEKVIYFFPFCCCCLFSAEQLASSVKFKQARLPISILMGSVRASFFPAITERIVTGTSLNQTSQCPKTLYLQLTLEQLLNFFIMTLEIIFQQPKASPKLPSLYSCNYCFSQSQQRLFHCLHDLTALLSSFLWHQPPQKDSHIQACTWMSEYTLMFHSLTF